MYFDKTKLCEAGYNGEELLHDSGISELKRKCFVIKEVVEEGCFTLEEALKAYEVSKEEFDKYQGNA